MVDVKGVVERISGVRKLEGGGFERGLRVAGMWFNLQHKEEAHLSKVFAGFQLGDVVLVKISPINETLVDSVVLVERKQAPQPKPVSQPKPVQGPQQAQKSKPVVQTPFQHAQLPPAKRSVRELYAAEVVEVLELIEKNPRIMEFQRVGLLAPVDLNAAVFTRMKLKMERGEK